MRKHESYSLMFPSDMFIAIDIANEQAIVSTRAQCYEHPPLIFRGSSSHRQSDNLSLLLMSRSGCGGPTARCHLKAFGLLVYGLQLGLVVDCELSQTLVC